MRHKLLLLAITSGCFLLMPRGTEAGPIGAFTQVSAGLVHTCGVRTDGTVACWGQRLRAGDAARRHLQPGQRGRRPHLRGEDGRHPRLLGGTTYGQATPPAGTFTQVSAGGCAHLRGEDRRHRGLLGVERLTGQATPPAGTFTQVSAGVVHTCGVKTDGTVACWGDNDYGQATPPAGTFTQVSAGGCHTCGVKTDGTLACWGDNDYGQATPPAGTFTQVSAGDHHTCGVRTDGTAGLLGVQRLRPGDAARRHLHPGQRGRLPHLRGEDGRHRGLLGGQHATARPRPPAAPSPPGQRGRLSHLRGADRWHPRLLGTTTMGRRRPPPAPSARSAPAMTHNCGVKTDGTLACWGDNDLRAGDAARRHLQPGQRGRLLTPAR